MPVRFIRRKQKKQKVKSGEQQAGSNYLRRLFPHPFNPLKMARQLISSGSDFEKKIGYSRAVVDGNWVFVSGTTGYNYDTMTISDDIVEQTEQCLANIEKVLVQAGSSMADVVRATYVLTDGDEFEKCWPVLQKYFGETRPAIMMLIAGLADAKMKIEIQVTALKK